MADKIIPVEDEELAPLLEKPVTKRAKLWGWLKRNLPTFIALYFRYRSRK